MGGSGALLGAAHADEPAGAAVAPLQLDPGAADHPTHREAKQIDGGMGAEGRLDVAAQDPSQFLHRGATKPDGQLGYQQGEAPISQPLLEAMEQSRGIPKTVHQHQRRVACHGFRLGSRGVRAIKKPPRWGTVWGHWVTGIGWSRLARLAQ